MSGSEGGGDGGDDGGDGDGGSDDGDDEGGVVVIDIPVTKTGEGAEQSFSMDFTELVRVLLEEVKQTS